MGGSASSELVTGEEGIKKLNNKQTNIGLLTMATESGMGGDSFNMIEIATCVLAVIISLYLLRWCCMKHQAKKMARLREALREVQIEPNMARLPVLQAPHPPPPPPPVHHLPAYPGLTTREARGAEIMAKYSA